jgi:hypothetical protein
MAQVLETLGEVMKSIKDKIGNTLKFSSQDHPLGERINFYDKLICRNTSDMTWIFLCNMYWVSHNFMREFPLIRNV